MFGMDEVLGATVSDSLKALPSVIRLPSHLPTWLTPSEEEISLQKPGLHE